MVLFQYVSFCASCVGHFRPTQKYKCMKKNKGCVCLTDPHSNTNLWENTKSVSVLQTHTEIQIYEKRSKNNDLCFTNCKNTQAINNYRKRKKTNNKVQIHSYTKYSQYNKIICKLFIKQRAAQHNIFKKLNVKFINDFPWIDLRRN